MSGKVLDAKTDKKKTLPFSLRSLVPVRGKYEELSECRIGENRFIRESKQK